MASHSLTVAPISVLLGRTGIAELKEGRGYSAAVVGKETSWADAVIRWTLSGVIGSPFKETFHGVAIGFENPAVVRFGIRILAIPPNMCVGILESDSSHSYPSSWRWKPCRIVADELLAYVQIGCSPEVDKSFKRNC